MAQTTGTQLPATVLSVNVGQPREIEWHGRTVTTAIWKDPVAGPVRVDGVNLRGDDQADRRVHGGPDKAVYAYASEDYRWWSTRRPGLGPGTFGDNLTTEGIDLASSSIGDRWTIGSTVLEVAQPRTPCFKLSIRMGEDGFTEEFRTAGRPGLYLRIVVPGTVSAGDLIEVLPARQPATSIAELSSRALDDAALRRVADDMRIPVGWRESAARALRSTSGGAFSGSAP